MLQSLGIVKLDSRILVPVILRDEEMGEANYPVPIEAFT
jgi:hypothetical protein